MTASRKRGEKGETLIEILLSLAILGVVLVGLITGLTAAIAGGAAQRQLTDVEVVARHYGEAIVQQARDPGRSTLAAATSKSSTSVSLSAPLTGLPDTSNFYIAIDAEVLRVTSGGAGTALTLSAPPLDNHVANAAVEYHPIYDVCVNASRVRPADYALPSAAVATVADPALNTPTLEFLRANGTPLPAGVCADAWETTLPCAGFPAPKTHLTSCDPAAVRVRFTVSTKSGVSQPGSTSTHMTIRRGNA